MLKSSVMHPSENLDPNSSDAEMYGTKEFYFQQRRGRLDLRTLSHIDLDRIVREVDIDALQLHLENITFCNLKEEDLRFLTDPQVIKLFRTAQLTIEYLLYVQEQLATNLQRLANKYINKKR
jgi:zinc finger protein DZIP1